MTSPVQPRSAAQPSASPLREDAGSESESRSVPAAWSRAWSTAVREPATEFDWTTLEVIAGEVPSDLRGSLYQNGAGRLERGGQRAGHWFDGDGAILAVRFDGGQAHACYRYVQTAGYCAEEAAGRYLQKSYGQLAPGPWPLRLLSDFKNAANTSVLPLRGAGEPSASAGGDRLLALWEGGPPHSVDLKTLETYGLDDLGGGPGGKLGPGETYSAHPRMDPVTGEIFNFGVQPGPVTWLNLYRSDRSGKILKRQRLRLKGVPLVHDMVLAGPYLVFCIPPVRLNLWPALLNLKSFSQSLQWNPDWGTEIIVVDRDSLNLVSRALAPAWFQWHFSNGYISSEAGSSQEIVIDLVRYPNFSTHEYLRTVPAGHIDGDGGGQFWRLRIDPQTAKLKSQSCLFEAFCEFPLVDPRQTGQRAEAAYFVAHPPGTSERGELTRAIARLDLKTHAVEYSNLGAFGYPSSPIYAGNWICSVVFDGEQRSTSLQIFAPEDLTQPHCVLQLPQIIPFGFHGCWHRSA